MARMKGMVLFLVSCLAFSAAFASPPPDGIYLRADDGPGLNDVTLSWTGGTPTFSVYASPSPVSLVQPANLQAVVGASPWIDVAVIVPVGTVRFYRVVATPPTCGNGSLEGSEGCDDGNVLGSDGCSPTCAIESGYSCAGQPSVCTGICGDGIVVFGEACDDGNATSLDGCSNTCSVESGYSCAGQPSEIGRAWCGGRV